MKWSLLFALVATGCGTSGAVYPPRPPAVPGLAVADPAPSRVVVHATVSAVGLKQALDLQIPKNGSGSFHAIGSDHKYVWSRQGVEVAFAAGRITVRAHVEAPSRRWARRSTSLSISTSPPSRWCRRTIARGCKRRR